MKAITKLAVISCSIAVLTSSVFAKAPEGWLIDMEKALEAAKQEKKAILVEFTGSDWCPPCMMMKKKVFSKPEFFKEASKDFVLLQLDFPKGDQKLTEKNEPFAEKYEIEGFPTVILLNSEGKEFNRFFASKYDQVDTFLAHLKECLTKKDLN